MVVANRLAAAYQPQVQPQRKHYKVIVGDWILLTFKPHFTLLTDRADDISCWRFEDASGIGTAKYFQGTWFGCYQ